jgi:hypothetical protein
MPIAVSDGTPGTFAFCADTRIPPGDDPMNFVPEQPAGQAPNRRWRAA